MNDTSPSVRRHPLRDAFFILAILAVISFLAAGFFTEPRLTPSGVKIHLSGIRLMTIPYEDIEQVRVRRVTDGLFSTNPFRRLRVGGCVRDDVVELKRRHGWFTTVVVCPWNRAGFVRKLEARRHH